MKESAASIERAYYCSFCGRYGHTTTGCSRVCRESPRLAPETSKKEQVHKIYTPVLEVTDKEENLRGLLIAYGQEYSQKQDGGKENKRRLKQLADEEGLLLVILNPKTGESYPYIDEAQRERKKKNTASAAAAPAKKDSTT
jgi:hypothetical protein